MKNSRRNTLILISLLLAVAILFAGCSSKKKTDQTGKGENKGNSSIIDKFKGSSFSIQQAEDKFDSAAAKADANAQKASAQLGSLIRESGKKIIKNINEDSFVFSPLSFYFAYASLYNGANDQGAAELKDLLLGDQAIDRDALNQAAGLLIREMTTNKGFQVMVNTMLAGRNDLDFAASFLQAATDYYEAVAVKMDFTQKEAVIALDNWTKEKTEGLIYPLFGEDYIFDPLTTLVLINTVYFQGDWQNSFDPNYNWEKEFFGLKNTNTVEMMSDRSYRGYQETDDYQLVSVSYLGGAEMHLYLPAEGKKPLDILLAEKEIDLSSYDIVLNMPKFDLESDIGLTEMLNDLAPSILTSGSLQELMTRADNPALDLYVSESFQKARVIVDEKGTEAAAATVIIVEETLAGIDMEVIEPLVITFDRPFAWEIVYNNVPLFTGVISDLP